jgi:hypothetical protein
VATSPRPEAQLTILPGLTRLLGTSDGHSGHRILDLGRAEATNLERYSQCATVVCFLDLLRDAPPRVGGPPWARELPDQILKALRRPESGAFDLVLVWDLLDYLHPTDASYLVGRLAEVTGPGATLHTMIEISGSLSESPRRHLIQPDDRVEIRSVSSATIPGPCLAPADAERSVRPFRVEHSVVLRHGVREIVAVRPLFA